VGTLYSAPINISRTIPFRAVAYKSGLTNSDVITHTFLLLTNVIRQPNNPAGYPNTFAPSGVYGPYPADYEMDPQVVNHTNYAAKWTNILTALPTLSIVTGISNLFDATYGIYYHPDEKGDEWERPISLEWLAPSNGPGFTAYAGLRIHGDASRWPWRQPKKNLRAYFKSEYGTSKLNFELFRPQGEKFAPVAGFDRLIFRNGGNRTWPYWDRDQRRETDYVNDEWSRRAYLRMGQLTAHGTYAHLYINGLYWGLYNITERLDEKFYASYFGGNPDTDYDVIEADEEFGDRPAAKAGTLNAYTNMLAAVAGSAAVNDTVLADLSLRVDFVSLVDYIILEHFVGQTDWPNHNWNVFRKRVGPDTRFKFSVWDTDSGLNKVNEDTSLLDDSDSPVHVFFRLATHVDFRQLIGDRVQKHLFNGGALSPATNVARYTELTGIIDQAIIGESARWGDYSRDVYQWVASSPTNKCCPAYLYSRDLPYLDADPGNLVSNSVQKNWLQVRGEKLTNYFAGRNAEFIAQYKANGWYDDTVKAPNFSKYGGAVLAGFNLNITNPNSSGAGEILYSVNGTDPRAPGGAVNPGGVIHGGDNVNITILSSTTVKARVLSNNKWSNLQDYTFTVPAPIIPLVINEINYKSATPDAGDWAEILNPTASTVNVAGWVVQDDDPAHTFTIPVGTSIPSGGFLVVAADLTKFSAVHPAVTRVVGNLGFGLGTPDSVVLRDNIGQLVDRVDYTSVAPWSAAPDGTGPTLALTNPSLDNSVAGNWSASAAVGGSPGATNTWPLPQPPPVACFVSTNSFALRYVIPAGMTAADFAIQKSSDLVNWTPGDSFFDEFQAYPVGDGTVIVTCRIPVSMLTPDFTFFRLARQP
jgi:hypothetical protein